MAAEGEREEGSDARPPSLPPGAAAVRPQLSERHPLLQKSAEDPTGSVDDNHRDIRLAPSTVAIKSPKNLSVDLQPAKQQQKRRRHTGSFGSRGLLALRILGLAPSNDRDFGGDLCKSETYDSNDVEQGEAAYAISTHRLSGVEPEDEAELAKMSLEELVDRVGVREMMRLTVRSFVAENWEVAMFSLLSLIVLVLLGRYAFDELSWRAWLSFGIVLALLSLLMKNTVPTQVSMLLAVTAMLLFRIISPSDALIGFANTGVATVCVLFAVAEGIQRTSVLRPIFRVLLGKPKGLVEAQLRLLVPVSLVSGFLNNTPMIAMMIPVVKNWSRRTGFPVSKLLMPLNDVALLGGTCTLLGTSTNLVVVGLASTYALLDSDGLPLEFPIFGVTPVGVPCLLAGLLYAVVASHFLIEDTNETITDVMNYPREYTVALKVEPKSPIVGETVQEAGLRQLHGLYLFELTRENGNIVPAPSPITVIEANDLMLFAGVVETVTELYHIPGIVPATTQSMKIRLQRHKRRLVEVVVNPSSFLVGLTVKDSQFRSRFKAAIIAVHRHGEHVREKIADIRLRAGDTLLLETGQRFLEFHEKDTNFALVSEVSGSQPAREDTIHMIISAYLIVQMIVVATLGYLDLLSMALLTVFLMVATRCMTMTQAAKSVSIGVILTVALSFGVARGLEKQGGASQLANFIIEVFSPFGKLGLLFGIYIGTATLSSIITNNAAVALMFPIVANPESGIIQQQNLNPYAALYILMLAASASFCTPISYQTNLMVHGPGGYTFGDWVKFGFPLQVLLCVVGVLMCYYVYR